MERPSYIFAPGSLSKFQVVDLHGFEGFERIVGSIKKQFKSKNQKINNHIATPEKKKIFISYCHEDKKWLDKLLIYLQPLEYEGIECYYDEEKEDDQKVQNVIENSQTAICLISNKYLGSELIRKKELPEILNKNKQGMLMIPVLVGQCAWKLVPWLKNLELFPKDLTPLVKKNEEEQEEILIDVVNAIGL